MTHEHTKQVFIQNIVQKTGFTTNDVHALMSGIIPKSYASQHINLIHALTEDEHGIFMALVWRGKSDPQHLRNIPIYHYIGQMIEGKNLYLHKYGYTSRLFITNEQLADADYFNTILSQYPDAGLINYGYLSPVMQRIFEQQTRPIVYLGYQTGLDPEGKYIIIADSMSVFESLVEYLYQLGHRRIAFIKGMQHRQTTIERYEGYCSGMAKVGLPLDNALVFDGNWYESSGIAAARLFFTLESPPTAIISSNDLMAMGAMKVIQERGLSIPQDISITGYNDIVEAEHTDPPLTSVRVPKTEIGTKLGETVVKLLQGETPSHYLTKFPVEIVHRQSTGPAPVEPDTR